MYKIKCFTGNSKEIEVEFNDFFKNNYLFHVDKLLFSRCSEYGTLIISFYDNEYDVDNIKRIINQQLEDGIAKLIEQYLHNWSSDFLNDLKEIYDKLNQHIITIANNQGSTGWNMAIVYQEILDKISELEKNLMEIKNENKNISS